MEFDLQLSSLSVDIPYRTSMLSRYSPKREVIVFCFGYQGNNVAPLVDINFHIVLSLRLRNRDPVPRQNEGEDDLARGGVEDVECGCIRSVNIDLHHR